MSFGGQASVVLMAQLRMYRNMLGRRGKAAAVLNFLTLGAWYVFVLAMSVLAGDFLAAAEPGEALVSSLQFIFFGIFLYWQLAPILTASFGLALDLKRLLIFPIRPGQFFLLDLVLSLPTSVEPCIVLLGAMAGLLRNPAISPVWVLPAAACFLCFNLFLGVAVRSLVTRATSVRWWKEGLVFVFVLMAATPQLLLLTNRGGSWLDALQAVVGFPWLPWAATANLAAGVFLAQSLPVTVAYAVLAFFAGRSLFGYFLSAESVSSGGSRSGASISFVRRSGFADLRAAMARSLGRPFPEPFSSLVEKEFLTYSRSPRFLTVFIMGFTFGILVFLPLSLRGGSEPGFMSQNLLTVVSAYAILLMSETVFWNVFGLDRKAVQMYLFAPVRLQHVFIAKNITAFAIVCLQVVLIALVCAVIGVPVTLSGVLEATVTAVVLAINMSAVGNQSSVRYPAGVNPDDSWSTANKTMFRLALMLLFPIISLPTSLAYMARFALDSDAGFYAGMAVAALIAVCFYLVSLDSTIEYARNHREDLVDLLGTTDSAV